MRTYLFAISLSVVGVACGGQEDSPASESLTEIEAELGSFATVGNSDEILRCELASVKTRGRLIQIDGQCGPVGVLEPRTTQIFLTTRGPRQTIGTDILQNSNLEFIDMHPGDRTRVFETRTRRIVIAPAELTDLPDRLRSAFLAEAEGTWGAVANPVSTPGGDAFVRATLGVNARTESVLVEVFADPDLQIPLFTYDSSGPYDIVGASSVVPGAWDINLRNESSLLTAFVDDPQLFASLGLDDCNLVVGEPVDVGDGCARPTFSVSDCIDHDIFAVVDNAIFTGEANTDRCTPAGRPTALAADGLPRAP